MVVVAVEVAFFPFCVEEQEEAKGVRITGGDNARDAGLV